MKTLYMYKGLPASGKSTLARTAISTYTGIKIVNKDLLREMLDAGKWSPNNEKFVLEVRDLIVSAILKKGYHCIVDDTNLHPKHETRLFEIAKENNAHFEVIDLTNVSVEECLKRDKKRPNYVGEKVILDMYYKFIAKKVEPPPFDTKKRGAIIVDIDGTVAEKGDRSAYDFSEKVLEDLPRWHVIESVTRYRNEGYQVLFVSGRDDSCIENTKLWLERYVLTGPCVFMRKTGDRRDDTIVKREIYETNIKDFYNIEAIFDDRPKVIRMWQSLGFSDIIFNVGTGEEF